MRFRKFLAVGEKHLAFVCNHVSDSQNLYVCSGGSLLWLDDVGEIHRGDNKPAIITPNGTLFFVRDGKLARVDGKPCIVLPKLI